MLVGANGFMSPKLQIESFCCAYWDYLRGLRDKPTGAEHGLCDCAAEAMARWCHNEFEKTTLQKAVEQQVA